MAEILSFPDKRNERDAAKLHDDMVIEEHRIKLLNLYAQMEHVVKQINYHKHVLSLLEKGIEK